VIAVPEEKMTESHFRMFALYSAIRDFFNPPRNWVAEADVQPGDTVLDFGCGRGGFAAAAARAVGPTGKVYALDLNPLALESTRKKGGKKKHGSVETILSDGATGLPDGSVDVVLLYDVFHELDKPGAVLAELARILKAGGKLSFSDHHLDGEEAVAAVQGVGPFAFAEEHKNTRTFAKRGQGERTV
jgi:ubiquinone/menaquinone biosynthesis C-methylase UbiE